MAKQTRREIYITCNGKSADDMIKVLTQHAADLDDRIEQLIADGKAETKECKELISVRKQLSAQLKTNISDTQLIDKVTKNLAGSSTKQLRAALAAVRREMERTSEEGGKLPQLRKQFEQLKSQIDKNTGAINNHGSAWQTAMEDLTAYVGMFTLFNKAKEMMTGVIKGNFEMSDSLADIRKVSGLLSQDIDKMAVSLAKIDTRTSISELNKIAYAGAKLGIGNMGVEALEGFVKASNQVNVALKEDMGEEALTALAKITEVMGLIPKMGVEQSMLKTGSAIFKLASTTTATSNKIVDFSNRLLAMGKTGALSTADILALGAAVDSMAMEPEVASTAFSKLITELRQGTNLIEKDLGLAKNSLKSLIEEGKGMEALQTIFHAMHESGNTFALNSLFKDLGSDGSRLIKVMVTMAEKVDMLDKNVKTANQAFNEGMAVTQEYNIQQQTAQGILERANSMWEKAFVNPDGINAVKQLAVEWYDFSKALTQTSYTQNAVSLSLSAMIKSFQILVNILPGIIGYLAGQGLVRGLATMWSIGKAVWAWVVAQRALNLAMSSNVFGLVVASLALVYTWFQKDANAAEQAAKSADGFTKSLRGAKNEVGKAIVELDQYKQAIDEAKKGTKERQAAINQFNDKFGQYLSKLITEKSTAQDLARAYNEATDAIERKVMAQAKESDIEQHVAPKAGREAQLLYDYDQMAKNNKKGAYGGEWLKAFVDDNLRKHGLNSTINALISRSNIGKGKNEQARAALFSAVRNTNGTPGDDYNWQHVSKGVYGQKHIDNVTTQYTAEERQVAMAVAYIRQRAAREKSQSEVNEKFKYYKDTPLVENVEGKTVAEQRDKEQEKKDKADARAQKEAWRKDLKQAQDEAKAVMSNLANYYERQLNEMTARLIADGASQSEIDLRLQPLRDKKDAAESQARRAISGKDNSWSDVKTTLRGDMLERTDPNTGVNLSKGLLDDILDVDIEALRKKMLNLEKSLNMPFNSSTAEIFANSTGNESNILDRQKKQMEARRKVAQENDYMGAVKQNMYDDFNTMGFANPTDEELASQSAFEGRKNRIIEMYEKARNEIARLYTIDVNTENGQGLLIKFLFGDDAEGMGARISAALGKEAADWQAFYAKLIQYSDNYAEAQKKTYDQQKKISDQMWAVNKRNLAQQKQIRDIQNESNLFGTRTNLLSNLGLANVTADPEIELMKARMQAAEDYYAFIEKNYRNKQLLQEADTARQEAELAYANQMATAMKNRLAQMKELVQPIEDFGAAMGEALATMRTDTESANEAIKSALKSMLQSWGKMAINDVNTQMWKAINDAGAKRGRANAQSGIDEARVNASADQSLANASTIGTAGNPAHVVVDNASALGGDVANGTNDVMGDATGSTGNATGNTTGNATGNADAPARAWLKRNRDNGAAGASGVPSGTGNATGSAVANAAAGGGGLADVGMSALGEAGSALLNTPMIGSGNSLKEDKTAAKQRKKELKEAKKHQKNLTRETEKGVKNRTKANQEGMDDITDATTAGGDAQSQAVGIAQDAMLAATTTGGAAILTATTANESAQTTEAAAGATARTSLSLVEAVGKCFAFLGPIGGPIAAAAVTATLMGLLAWAIGAAFGGSKNSSSSSSGTNTKLKTGMLTYDSGNVQDLKPFVGDNGEMYWATEDNVPKSGVNLLSSPTATTINGQRSLVAENGPELVIGRETTKAMMMNNPALLKALVNYDSNYSGRSAARRTFDEGNVAEVAVANTAQLSGASTAQSAASDATNTALLQAISALMTRLEQPINAQINMFGRGGLHESMNKANQFMKGK